MEDVKNEGDKGQEKVEVKQAEKTPQQDVSKGEKKQEAVKSGEKPANCPVCNKSLKKKWYYRNMKYFCGQGCFKQDLKKAKEVKEEKK